MQHQQDPAKKKPRTILELNNTPDPSLLQQWLHDSDAVIEVLLHSEYIFPALVTALTQCRHFFTEFICCCHFDLKILRAGSIRSCRPHQGCVILGKGGECNCKNPTRRIYRPEIFMKEVSFQDDRWVLGAVRDILKEKKNDELVDTIDEIKATLYRFLYAETLTLDFRLFAACKGNSVDCFEHYRRLILTCLERMINVVKALPRFCLSCLGSEASSPALGQLRISAEKCEQNLQGIIATITQRPKTNNCLELPRFALPPMVTEVSETDLAPPPLGNASTSSSSTDSTTSSSPTAGAAAAPPVVGLEKSLGQWRFSSRVVGKEIATQAKKVGGSASRASGAAYFFFIRRLESMFLFKTVLLLVDHHLRKKGPKEGMEKCIKHKDAHLRVYRCGHKEDPAVPFSTPAEILRAFQCIFHHEDPKRELQGAPAPYGKVAGVKYIWLEAAVAKLVGVNQKRLDKLAADLKSEGKDCVDLESEGKDCVVLESEGKDCVHLESEGKDCVDLESEGKDREGKDCSWGLFGHLPLDHQDWEEGSLWKTASDAIRNRVYVLCKQADISILIGKPKPKKKNPSSSVPSDTTNDSQDASSSTTTSTPTSSATNVKSTKKSLAGSTKAPTPSKKHATSSTGSGQNRASTNSKKKNNTKK